MYQMPLEFIVHVFLLIVLVLWIVVFVASQEPSKDNCPWGTFAMDNKCLLIELKARGNFTQNRALCQSKNASLLSIDNINNLENICQIMREKIRRPTLYAFLGADRDENNTNEYIWHHDKRRVNFPRKFWVDEVPQADMECIEIFIHRDYCRLNDIVCWKTSWPICELRSRNSCLKNNGGCQQICVSRGVNGHTCKCKPGAYIANKTKCVTETRPRKQNYKMACYDGYDYVHNFTRGGDCVKLLKRGVNKVSLRKTCSKKHLLTMSPSTFPNVCEYVKTKTQIQNKFWLGIHVNIIPPYWYLDEVTFDPSAYKKRNPFSNAGAFHWILSVEKGECLLDKVNWPKMLGGICQNNNTFLNACFRNNGNCSQICKPTGWNTRVCGCFHGFQYVTKDERCEDVDECQQNGGNVCHHQCRNTIGGVICSCFEGYSLDPIYYTECSPNCHHDDTSTEYVVGVDGKKCGCLPNYTLIDTFTCRRIQLNNTNSTADDTINNSNENKEFSLTQMFGILTAVVSLIVVIGILSCKCTKIIKGQHNVIVLSVIKLDSSPCSICETPTEIIENRPTTSDTNVDGTLQSNPMASRGISYDDGAHNQNTSNRDWEQCVK